MAYNKGRIDLKKLNFIYQKRRYLDKLLKALTIQSKKLTIGQLKI
jgi:hypothetical protein